jgi:hypothetical protein
VEAGAVSELQGIGRFMFHDGELGEFKRLAAQCMEIVRAKDTGTLGEAISATGWVSGELLGEPSAELRAKKVGSGVRLFTPFQSM